MREAHLAPPSSLLVTFVVLVAFAVTKLTIITGHRFGAFHNVDPNYGIHCITSLSKDASAFLIQTDVYNKQVLKKCIRIIVWNTLSQPNSSEIVAKSPNAATPFGALALVIRMLRILLHANLLNLGFLVAHLSNLLPRVL